jgi:hypothetical protein
MTEQPPPRRRNEVSDQRTLKRAEDAVYFRPMAWDNTNLRPTQTQFKPAPHRTTTDTMLLPTQQTRAHSWPADPESILHNIPVIYKRYSDNTTFVPNLERSQLYLPPSDVSSLLHPRWQVDEKIQDHPYLFDKKTSHDDEKVAIPPPTPQQAMFQTSTRINTRQPTYL